MCPWVYICLLWVLQSFKIITHFEPRKTLGGAKTGDCYSNVCGKIKTLKSLLQASAQPNNSVSDCKQQTYEPHHDKTCFCHMRTTKNRCRSACTSVQSDQLLCCSLPRSYNTFSFYIWNIITLAGLFSWAGRFVSYLVANPKDTFLTTWLIYLCLDSFKAILPVKFVSFSEQWVERFSYSLPVRGYRRHCKRCHILKIMKQIRWVFDDKLGAIFHISP